MQRRSVAQDTISVHFVLEALQAVARHDVPVPLVKVLDKAGIPASFLEEPLARVSPQQFGILWRELALQIDDEFFALDRRGVRRGTFAMLCTALLHCKDLHQVLRRICRYTSILFDDIRAELDVQGDVATLCLHDAQARTTPFAHATYFMALYGVVCWLIAHRISLLQCRLGGQAGTFGAEYRIMFCEDLTFGAVDASLTFPSELLKRPVRQNAASLHTFLLHSPDVFLVKYRNTDSLAGRVRMWLRSMAPGDWPELPQAAQHLGLSTATFRRRLGHEGVTFQSIKNDLRRDMAITQLRSTTQSLEDLAHRLGFTETAAFHRAFRKWTGMRPSDYRQNLPAADR